MKQKTEPEGWQSNHEGSADKALYSLSLSLVVSFALPVDQFTAPRGLGYYASRLGVRSWPLLCQSGDYFGKDEGCFPSCSRFPSVTYLPTYLPLLPLLPSPDYTFPRAPASELNCPVRSHFSPFLLSSFPAVKKKEKKKMGKRKRERSARGWISWPINSPPISERKPFNVISYSTPESSDLCNSLPLPNPVDDRETH